jgi:hypothetical protein
MGNPVDAAALAKSFEPILLFHQNEQFFPIDPKWYLERCALWKATPRPFDDKNEWIQPPLIEKSMIAALPGPKEVAGGKTYIGTPGAGGETFGISSAPIGEQPPPDTEYFLEFVGWEPVSAPPVTPMTNNRHAALHHNEYTVALQDSTSWYWVEYLDNTDLQNFTANPNLDTSGLKLFVTVTTKLAGSRVILYHLFYPLHQETLEGCEDAGEGRLFGSYAGEWGCIAIVMDALGKPSHIGLTSRNTGTPSMVSGDDKRIGMTIFEWKDADVVTDATGGMHPKIFVSLDTHGHYLKTGNMPLTPFTPGGLDPSRQSCGEVEGLDDAIKGDIVIPGAPGEPGKDADWGIMIAKSLLIMASLGVAAPWVIDWMKAEGAAGSFGTGPDPDTLKSPDATPVDVTGGPDFGRIIRPKGLDFDETAHAATLEDWNVRKFTAPNPDGRAYDFIVDRSKQVWWVPRPSPRPRTTDLPNPNGFSGRWGPRVTNDPNSRRAGGKCPDFALQFLEALTVKLNPA